MNSLLVSPHNDDETLFASYTILREHPLVLVVTDGYIQQNRGDNITPRQRRIETVKALEVLGAPVYFGAIRDDSLDEWSLRRLFQNFKNFKKIYIPARQGGNAQHDLIYEVASEVYSKNGNIACYATYAKNESYTPLVGPKAVEIKPTEKEWALKNLALDCYQSQISLLATYPHFQKVRELRSEWLI